MVAEDGWSVADLGPSCCAPSGSEEDHQAQYAEQVNIGGREIHPGGEAPPIDGSAYDHTARVPVTLDAREIPEWKIAVIRDAPS